MGVLNTYAKVCCNDYDHEKQDKKNLCGEEATFIFQCSNTNCLKIIGLCEEHWDLNKERLDNFCNRCEKYYCDHCKDKRLATCKTCENKFCKGSDDCEGTLRYLCDIERNNDDIDYHWEPLLNNCSSCDKNDIIYQNCFVCDKNLCPEHSNQCDCKEFFCYEHSFFCNYCEDVCCKKCLDKCQLCSKYYCKKECSTKSMIKIGIDKYCYDCLEECIICKNFVFKESLQRCNKCDLLCCRNCSDYSTDTCIICQPFSKKQKK